ncbi:MAG: cupredoxin domain-containing protein [Dehalococcoidales bacterium]|nr:cupredoxin domain-containing protein [Dehalococcoidales bacterium]
MSRIVSVLFIGVLLILPNCAKSVAPVEKQLANEVWVPGREFRPSIITVPAGTTVTWVDKDRGEEHTVTSSTGLFNGSLAFGGSFNYTFTERGTFEYSCQVHAFEGMTGKVVVE